MVYDRQRELTLLFGGAAPGNSAASDEMWAYDGEVWTPLLSQTGTPPARTEHTMAYDSDTGLTYVYGGHPCTQCSDETLDDLWMWDGES